MKPAKLLFNILTFTVLTFFVASVQEVSAAEAVLKLSPASGAIEEGETLDVDIVVNTGGADVVAVDVVMEFDPSKFEISVDRSKKIFDEMFPSSGEEVDNEAGRVRFSTFVSSAGDPFSGEGAAAVLKVKAKDSSGSGDISFQFTPDVESDCNIVEVNTIADILSSVSGGTYTLAAGGEPTPTPTAEPEEEAPTPTPTPTPSSSDDVVPTPTLSNGGDGGTGAGGSAGDTNDTSGNANDTSGGDAPVPPATGDSTTLMFVALLGFSLLLSGILLVF